MQTFNVDGYPACYFASGHSKLLISVGDSWPAGHGAVPPTHNKLHVYENHMVTHSYPYFLHKMQGDRDLLSTAYPGAGIHGQYEALKKYLHIANRYDSVMVILGIDAGMRHHYRYDKHKHVCSAFPGKCIGKEYFDNIDFDFLHDQFCSRIFDFQCLCKVYNFEFWFVNNWMGDLNQHLDISVFKDLVRLDNYIDFDQHGNARTMLTTNYGNNIIQSCKHPTAEGHKYIAT